ncbi:TonB-linked SusC/RagA family outer membrane protein [Dysgonomonas alginatilytica]|uniref:TonB-linked SusC/RagA family outer membrane protein n=1 Tax=Dysgonomonas alginatilytica TaxID=1605892 RepID=A0A2V3PV90_9BACT|nr:SusC/RagA family TonB-linked outer membrane protein [Dysgonomonas alginatilytica]PXV63564.1 TonB-linked SusC/RagA family outer membrane protein [Dysgonomonas alginatilytica]
MKNLILILCLTCLPFLSLAQTTKVQGKIISSEDRMPLIGATVKVKGTNISSSSDLDGNYVIDADAKATLVFSYISFETKEESVNGRKEINVSLSSDAKILEDVVVMGYSSMRKAELSSAVVTLKGDQVTDITTSDIGNMIQGKVAGVMVSSPSGQPGSTAVIQIRGTGSISAAPDPLFVVDGIPGGSFNPNDVETLTVLKDAGATALYGSAAAGGVIVVTTKSASKDQPTKVNFKSNIGLKNALQGNFSMMNGAEIYDVHAQLFPEAILLNQRPEELRNRNFDWRNAAFQTGNIQNYYLSTSGGTAGLNYFSSIDYYKEDGTLKNTNFDRISARLNLNRKLYDNLDMNIRLNYTENNGREASSYINLEGAYGSMPWDNPFDENGNPVKINGDKRPDNGQPWYTQDKRNFFFNEQYNYAKNKAQDLVADLQLNWNIYKWMSLSTTNRASRSNYKYSRYIDSRTIDPEYATGYLLNNIGLHSSWGSTNLLKLNHSFSDHSLSGMLGLEFGKSVDDFSSAAGIGMPGGMDALGAATPKSVDGHKYTAASWSAFGQIQYNYINKYFLTASFRADTNSRFGKDTRTGYFPSVAGSWLLSNEAFLSNNDVISFLKLRANYGVTGNSNIDLFRTMAVYTLSSITSSYQNNVGAVAERLANPDLSWESAYMSGLGVDISLWKRLHINLDVYNIDNKDLLLEVPKPTSTGFYNRLENAGSVRNRGVEIQISSDNIKTKDFNWNTSFNIGFNKNKVMSLPNNESFLQKYGTTSIAQQVKTGQDIFSWYMPKWLGVDYVNGDPVWEKLIRDDNGNVIGSEGTNDYAQADLQVVGKASPKFTGGFTNTVEYKGIGLYIAGSFVYGNDVYNYTREKYDSDGAYLGYNMMNLQSGWIRWQNPGDVATHPKLVMNGNKNSNKTSSRFLEDGSFLRIRNITLSYNLQKTWIEKLKMQSCKVFVSVDNALTFTKFSGTDPEVNMRKASWSLPGLYSESYPVSRQFIFGIDINF